MSISFHSFSSTQSIEFFFDKEVTHFVTDKHIERDGKLLNAHYIQQHQSSQSNRTTNANVVVTPHTPQQQNPTSSLLLSELTDTASPNGTSNDARVSQTIFAMREEILLFKIVLFFLSPVPLGYLLKTKKSGRCNVTEVTFSATAAAAAASLIRS